MAFIGFDINLTFADSPGINGDLQPLQILLFISGSLKQFFFINYTSYKLINKEFNDSITFLELISLHN